MVPVLGLNIQNGFNDDLFLPSASIGREEKQFEKR